MIISAMNIYHYIKEFLIDMDILPRTSGHKTSAHLNVKCESPVTLWSTTK